ncbi:hypothetical protein ABZ746_05860 [Streptomyces sp. NPDC020096]
MRECAVVGAEAAQFALAPRRGVHGPQQPLLGGLMTPEDDPDAVLHRSQQIRLAQLTGGQHHSLSAAAQTRARRSPFVMAACADHVLVAALRIG